MEKEEKQKNGNMNKVLVLMALMFFSTLVLSWIFAGWQTNDALKDIEKEVDENNQRVEEAIRINQENNQKIQDMISAIPKQNPPQDNTNYYDLLTKIENLKVGVRVLAENHPYDPRFSDIAERLQYIEIELANPQQQIEDYDYTELLALIEANNALLEETLDDLHSGEFTRHTHRVIYTPGGGY